jgi:hypothetical protein
MVTAMFLAHLVGDYVLQWDGLACWKSRELKGVLAHGAIVGLVAWLFSLRFAPGWWPYVLVIALTHVAVDAAPLALQKRCPLQSDGRLALARYLIDQLVHIGVILAVLVWSGYLTMPSLVTGLVSALQDNLPLAFVLGYAFITTPTWVLVQFLVHGLINGSTPDFTQTGDKYMGILERGLITTFVMTGQFVLVPVVTLPRLVFDGPRVMGTRQSTLYVAELLASVTLAIAIGMGLRYLWMRS